MQYPPCRSSLMLTREKFSGKMLESKAGTKDVVQDGWYAPRLDQKKVFGKAGLEMEESEVEHGIGRYWRIEWQGEM